MDFLDRLRVLMEKNGDNNSTLSKKSGIPYTTIDGLFKRGWEKAQISTIQNICKHYGVSLDYMVYGADKLSSEALIVAAKYESASEYSRTVIDCILDNENAYVIRKKLPVIETVHDSDMYARYNSMRERQELELEQRTENKSN